MSKCRENPIHNKHISITSKPKGKRECSCIKEYNQLKNNIRTLQAISQSGEKKQSKSCKSKNMHSEKPKCDNFSKQSRNNTRTWFDVLRESPRKETAGMTSNSPDKRHQRISSNINLFGNIGPKGSTPLIDDETFLKTMIRMNDLIQSHCSNTLNLKASLNHRDVSITDDDKFKTYMGKKQQEKSQEQIEKQNLTVKALVKLLENMQFVSQNSEVQRETLDNLTLQLVQLREENKMLDRLKEVRIGLESKLSSLVTENLFLKKQLHIVEKERDKANHLLESKEKEVAMLKNHITTIKGKIASKIDSGIKYDLDDPTLELNYLEDTLASLPSCNQSFDAPIRPASSSPTEEIIQKWRNKSFNGRLDEDSGIQSNPQGNCESLIDNKSETVRKQVLTDLKNNVKKTVENFQLDMKFNDVSLNLSDGTYKLSSSTIM